MFIFTQKKVMHVFINQRSRYKFHPVFLGIVLLLVTSCVPVRKLRYVQADRHNKYINTYTNKRVEKTIQPYDNLYIQVFSLDQNVSGIFSGQNNIVSRTDPNLISYTVNDSGFIHYPFVDKIYLKDLTIDEASRKIQELLSQYVINISVTVRFVGNKITVLGEVRNPGEFPYYNEKLTIFQALGFAGDVASMGNKKDVVLIREIDGVITYYQVDLTKKNIVESPLFFLIPNDVIIVNPLRAKYRTLRDLSLWGSLLTTISTSLAVIIFIQNQNTK